jgi:hypothetical protein
MNSLLNLWNVGAVTISLVVIVVTAIGMMVGLIELGQAFKRIGRVLGALVLLLAVPPIILGIWRSLRIGQQFGIIVLFLLVGMVALRGRVMSRKKPERGH